MTTTLANPRFQVEPPASNVVPTTSSDRLVLRLHGPQYSGAVMRIADSKCSIGSAANCTLRVAGPGVKPLHCSIIRGPRGSIVRRWCDETQLNGRDFQDAVLQPGDRITCGSVEIEVLAGVRPGISFPAQATTRTISWTVPGSSTAANRIPVHPAETATSAPRSTERVQAVRQLVRQRMRRVIAQLRAARWELARREAETQRAAAAALSQSQLDQTLQTRVDELETLVAKYREQLTQSEQRVAQVDGERQNLVSQLGRMIELENDKQLLQEQLIRLQNEFANEAERGYALDHQVNDLQQRHDDAVQNLHLAEDEKLRLQESLNQALAELANCEAQLRTAHDADQSVTALAAERDELRAKLAADEETIADLQQKRGELQEQLQSVMEQHDSSHAQYVELVAERDKLQAQLSEATAAAAQTPTHDTVDVVQLATKMQEIEQVLLDLRSQNDQLRDQVADLTRENDEATQSYQTAESSRQQLESLVQELSAQLQNASTEAAANATSAHDDEKLAAIEAQTSEWRQRAESLQTRLNELEQEREQWQRDRRRLQFAEKLNIAAPEIPSESNATTAGPTNMTPLAEVMEDEEIVDSQSEYLARRSRFFQKAQREDSVADEATLEVAEVVTDFDGKSENATEEPTATATDPADAFQSPLLASLLRNRTEEPTEPAALASSPNSFASSFAAEPEVADSDEPQEIVDESSTSAEESATSGSSASPHAPVSAASILAKLGHQIPMDDADEPSTSATLGRTPAPSAASASTVSPLSAHPPTEHKSSSIIPNRGESSDEEESIEDYMARLMKRVRGDAAATAYQEQTAKTNASSASPAEQTAEAESDEAKAIEEKPKYVPRALPAEFAANLSVMREIANSSARTAIETHQKRNWKETARAKYIAATSAFIASLAILYYSHAGMFWQFGGALAGFGLTGYWIWQARKMSKEHRQPKGAAK